MENALETFLARARERDRIVPRFVEREFRAYLACGIAAHGFLRVHCDTCGLDRLVPYSCKRRGFCPSCGGRRVVTREKCEHCGAAFAPPQKVGIEIFESAAA